MNSRKNSKGKILIVEDDAGSRKLLKLFFSGLGYEVAEGVNGFDAVDLARAIKPDVIITDLELPGMTGDEVIKQLKADPFTNSLPVIVTTFFDPEAVLVRRAIDAGAAKVLYKPTSMKVFEAEVRRLLSRH